MLADATVTERLPEIACPVLLIAGTHDALRPPTLIEPLAGKMRNARFVALETSHFMACRRRGSLRMRLSRFWLRLEAEGNAPQMHRHGPTCSGHLRFDGGV